MKSIEELRNTAHLCVQGEYGLIGGYHGFVDWPDFNGTVVWGYNEGGVMEHVSVAPRSKTKTPSWEIMCRLKDMFWNKDEMVIQIHPAEKDYFHGFKGMENILHLWRPSDGNFSVLNNPEMWS